MLVRHLGHGSGDPVDRRGDHRALCRGHVRVQLEPPPLVAEGPCDGPHRVVVRGFVRFAAPREIALMTDACGRDLPSPRDQAVLGLRLREPRELHNLVDAELAVIQGSCDRRRVWKCRSGLDQPACLPIRHPIAHPQPLRQVACAVVGPDTCPRPRGSNRTARGWRRRRRHALDRTGRSLLRVHRSHPPWHHTDPGEERLRDVIIRYRTCVRVSTRSVRGASLRAMVRRLATVLVIVASIGVVAPAARAAPTVVDVSRRTTNQSEAAVAASPLHPNDVAIASNLQHGFGVLVSVSHDGGATWAHEVLGDADAFGRACCDPTIAWDRFGDLFVSWLGYGKLRYPTVVPVLLSTDAGDTWSLLTRIKPPAAVRRRPTIGVRAPLASAGGPKDGEEDRGPGFLDQPTITTGANSLWAIWKNEGQMQGVGAPNRGLGDVAPLKPVHDVPGGHNCTFGDVAVGPGGAVAEICQKDQDRFDPVRS